MPERVGRTKLMKAFRRESKRAHPDRAAQNGIPLEQATEQMKSVNCAKDVLLKEILADDDGDDE